MIWESGQFVISFAQKFFFCLLLKTCETIRDKELMGLLKNSVSIFLVFVFCFVWTFSPLQVYGDVLDAEQKIETTQSKLKDAEDKLNQLGDEIVSVGEDLNETEVQLQSLKEDIRVVEKKIEVQEKKIDTQQEKLAERCATDYKLGTGNLLDLFMGAKSVEDVVSKSYYQYKVTEKSKELIDGIKDMKSSLEDEKEDLDELLAKQKSLLADKEEKLASLKGKQQEQEKYVEGLSEDLLQALEKKQQEELEEQKRLAEEQAKALAEGAISQGTGSATKNVELVDGFPADGPTKEQREKILEAAFSQLGVKYVYGSMSPNKSFDCSGLTSWAYSQAGLGIPHSAQSQANYIENEGVLYPGDLVVWIGGMNALSGNHVAIYIGNGMIIHASYSGVSITSLAYMRAPTKVGHVVVTR